MGLIDVATPLDPYQVTTDGRDLLTSQALRLDSIIDTPAANQVDSLAVCPRCGNPITALTAATTRELTPAPCECQLSSPALDPIVTTLLEAYPSVTDRDAAHYLRQALYLLLPRADE